MAAAKKTPAKKDDKKTGTELVKKDQLPVGIDLESHAGGGMENTDRDSFAIPFLAIMQKGSPQVDKDDEQYVPGVETGDLMMTTSQQIFKDEDGVDVIFCGYRRVFLRWAPLDSGGGFKGELTVADVQHGKATGEIREEDNKLFANNGDIIKDTRVHYVLVLDPVNGPTPAVLSISSTQIKKSKMLMTQLDTYKAEGAKGKFTPPSFAHTFHVETIAESNDKGSWRGWKFNRVGYVEDASLFALATNFAETVKTEKVNVDYNAAEGGSAATEDDDKI